MVSILPLPLAPVVSLLGLPSPVTLYTVTTTVDAVSGFPLVAEVGAPHTMIVQPVSGRDMERATGGTRHTAGLRLHSREPIPLNAQLNYAEPGGSLRRWLVIQVADWKSQGGFYSALAVAP